MKSFTDIEQSKKLAEILPIKSADMCFYYKEDIPQLIHFAKHNNRFYIPCWSLAALLGVLPSASLDSSDDHYFRMHCKEKFSEWYDNPIDAAFETINKLKENNLL